MNRRVRTMLRGQSILFALVLLVSHSAFAQAPDGLPFPNPYNANTQFEGAKVASGGSASSSSTGTNSGSSQVGLPMEEEGYTQRKVGSSITMFGGDNYNTRNAAMMSIPILRSWSEALFKSPMTVFTQAVGNTDATVLAAFQTANEEGHQGARGTHEIEANYLRVLASAENGPQLREAYFYCKKQFLEFKNSGSGGSPATTQRTDLEAIKKCIGTMTTAAPEQEATLSSSKDTQFGMNNLYLNHDYPLPIYLETFERQDPSQWRSKVADCQANGAPDSCFKYSLWNFIFHHITKPAGQAANVPNHLKNRLMDEARTYYGNVLITEKGSADEDGSTASGQYDPEHLANTASYHETSWEQTAPLVKAVVFWGKANGSNATSLMQGFDLMKAKFLNDIYGSIYTLSYQMCEWDNYLANWARSPGGGGFAAMSSSGNQSFWEQPITVAFGTAPAILPTNYLDMWQGQQGPGVNPPLTGSVPPVYQWKPKRFYQYTDMGVPWQNKAPTFHELLGNLSAGSVTFSHADAMMLDNIFSLQTKGGGRSWRRDCDLVLEGAGLGDIMDFQPAGNYASTTLSLSGSFVEPANASWPLKSQYTSSSGNLGDYVISKRYQLLYQYAITAAELRALSQTENFRLSLRRQVLADVRWKDHFDVASQLVARNLPGGSHTSTATTTMKIQELSEELAQIRKDLYDYYEEIKTYSKVTTMLSSRSTGGSGLQAFGSD